MKKKKQSKADCILRVREMVRINRGWLIEESERLYNSGGINPYDYKSGQYALPRILLHVALKNLADKLITYSSQHKKDIKNLKHF